MRYTLADLEKRFANRPNARWSSIHAELKREQMASDLIATINREEAETTQAAQMIADAVVQDMPKQSYFDRLMKWATDGIRD